MNNNKIRQINISLHSFNSLDEVKDIVNRQVYMDLGKIISDDRV